MSILRNPNRHRYTVIDSLALEDTSISFEAKGVLAYLLSKPDGWLIHQEHLSRVGGIGRHKIMRIFSELRKAGYIAYKKPRNEFGQVEGTEIVLCETPRQPVAKPECGINRESENPTLGKPAPLVNLDYLVNLDEEKKLNPDVKDTRAPKSATHGELNSPKLKHDALDYSSWPQQPSAQVLTDWHAARKAKKLVINQTVITRLGGELRKAYQSGYSVDDCLSEMVTRGWQGLKVEWLQRGSGEVERGNNGYNQTGANTNGTHRQNSGPLSAVDRVNAAISARARERDQREAVQRGGRVFNADGVAVEAHDGNVRSPLD